MLLNSKTSDELKHRLYEEQNGCCKLCGHPFEGPYNKQHLDHDHALDGPNAGRVRGLLCIRCNPLEGAIQHEFVRSGLRTRGVDYLTWLKSMIAYIESDHSSNPLHSRYFTDKVKRFSKLTLPEMRNEMQHAGFEYNNQDTKSDLVKKFKKQFKKAIQ